ncbi:hypothetical protein CONPUDRAFT_146305 [Coniophora puteana RWD-64-598 SS2]|uniref:Uncharacterized protein n=1 Tax=Coniophora puteana (strain RWD-64-598) TaxID=741705 RepID=A0A5M3MFE3_CONPW|nr:uncharacterized protein CONPUDRAFT_146305 [Coniophora puteana RWD-64-598 SS2]EIW77311.1 hypothetical protein CONPUDRAFT_146305 [Coniophora puteana RWD-64-598 SS2]
MVRLPPLPLRLYVSLDPIPGSPYFPLKELNVHRGVISPTALGRDGRGTAYSEPSTQENGYFPYVASGGEDFGDLDNLHALMSVEEVVDQNGDAVGLKVLVENAAESGSVLIMRGVSINDEENFIKDRNTSDDGEPLIIPLRGGRDTELLPGDILHFGSKDGQSSGMSARVQIKDHSCLKRWQVSSYRKIKRRLPDAPWEDLLQMARDIF